MINLAVAAKRSFDACLHQKIADYTRSQLNHFYNSLLHKTYSRIAEKEIISFTIKFFVIHRRIVGKTISKNRRTTILFDHNKNKKKKKS